MAESLSQSLGSFDTDELKRVLPRVIAIARHAGDVINTIYRGDYEVTEKSDDTPLTTADLEAHRDISSALAELTPDIPVLSEESAAAIPFAERHAWDTYWLVDPLDGTREFIKGSGEFSVNIALVRHSESCLGVIYAPVLDVLYFAARGAGAWKVPKAGAEPERIHVRKAPQDKVTVARSRAPTAGPNLQYFLDKLGAHEEVAMGSALKSCLVAEGRADVYARLGPTSEWDTGAAQCIVEEAGGHICDTAMHELRYNTKESLLNPHFFVTGEGAVDWSAYLPEALRKGG
ncbi:MAG: 3'(2'),5'-bisphosphate nucleotidase CysQ [Pseudomonadota bacterium]